MIGRFWGAVTPGGLGLDGSAPVRDAKHTGKARAPTALRGVEKVLGQLAFGAVVMVRPFGLRVDRPAGLLLVNGWVPGAGRGRAHAGRGPHLSAPRRCSRSACCPRLATVDRRGVRVPGQGRPGRRGRVLGVATHAFNNLIYVCTARALGVELERGRGVLRVGDADLRHARAGVRQRPRLCARRPRSRCTQRRRGRRSPRRVRWHPDGRLRGRDGVLGARRPGVPGAARRRHAPDIAVEDAGARALRAVQAWPSRARTSRTSWLARAA